MATIRVLVFAAAIYYVSGNHCAAVSCPGEGADEEQTLQLLQRRARSVQVDRHRSSEIQQIVNAIDAHLASNFTATAALDRLEELGHVWGSRGAAAWIIGLWVTTFAVAVSCMMSSVLAAGGRGTSASSDRSDVTAACAQKGGCDRDILDVASAVNGPFHCLSFSWMDCFLAAPGQLLTAGRKWTEVCPPAANLWNLLQRAVGNPLLLLGCAWLVAFLELVAMVLILDGLLLLHETRGVSGLPAARVTLAVLGLLFVIPLLYRYLNAQLSMFDGLQVARVSNELTSMLYQKALRLPIGASYHGHKADEELTGWQVAKALVEGIAHEWPLLLRSLALLTAAPCMACILLLLLVLHLRFVGLLGFLLLFPGAILAGLLVKIALSSRRSYQHWQSERQKVLRLRDADTGAEAIKERILSARHGELVANQWYSVMMALLAGTLHAMVWLVVVASLYSATRNDHISARNLWLMLQMVTSLQACGALIFAGLRRAWTLPGALRRLDCFLQHPEMPRDVVRHPITSTAPTARISGSFSFEEGGPLVLHDLDLSLSVGEVVVLLGDAGSGKSALLMALMGELFPCGLAYVSSTSKRCFVRGGADAMLDSRIYDNPDVPPELLLWDYHGEVTSDVLKRLTALAAHGTAVLLALRRDAGDGSAQHRVLRLQQGRLVTNEVPDAAEPPEVARTPLKQLGEALQLALEGEGSREGPCQGEALPRADLWPMASAYLGTCGTWNVALVVVLVLMQRSAQLLQFLFLANWADAVAMGAGVDHRGFAASIVITVAINALLLTCSEWAGGRLASVVGLHLHARQPLCSSDLAEVDSVLISGTLGCARSVLGSFLQQCYILLIAPQWLAVTVLLPAYFCIVFFARISLHASVLLALKGEDSQAEAQQIMHQSLDPDPVQVRGNQLQRQLLERFRAQMHQATGAKLVLSAANKSWLSFRVTFCVAFASTSCALQVLLCDQGPSIGVGSFGLVISLLFALTSDVELACESCVQACRALSALQRLGAFVAEQSHAAVVTRPWLVTGAEEDPR